MAESQLISVGQNTNVMATLSPKIVCLFSDTAYHATTKARGDIPGGVCNPVTVVASSVSVVESL